MQSIIIDPTSTASWYSLLLDAQKASNTSLIEEIESYLVFLLMRFVQKPELASSVLGLEFINALQNLSATRQARLQEVGDKCLLLTGLFPERTQKKQLKMSYFVHLGQIAYRMLSLSEPKNLAKLYDNLCVQFVPAMDVLQATRNITFQKAKQFFTHLEHWQETGSQQSYQKMQDLLAKMTPAQQAVLTKLLMQKQ
ncbi:MAG TPA: hypothetical protein VJ205_04670 [Gammaproteobacteria bacterium]|nr:hypothetical protein [Gammaproteobacteria bacterium]